LAFVSSSVAFAVPRFAYTANYFGSSISIYRVDAETGMLHHLSHVPTFKSPSTVILHPTGKFLFTVSQTVDQIAIYRVDAQTGALTEIPESPIPSGTRSAWQLEVSPDGKYLYVPGVFSSNLMVFKIDPERGALTPLTKELLPTHGERVRFIETTPDGRFVYVGNAFSDTVAAFAVNAAKGRVSPVTDMPFAAGSTPQGIMAHPNGKFLYIANWQTATLSAFAIDQAKGGLTPLPGKPVDAGYFPFGGMTDPAGDFLYVANWGASTVSSYRVDKQSGTLEPLPGMPAPTGGLGPITVVVDNAGRYAYVPNHEDVSLTIFERNVAGALVNPRRMYTRPGVRRLVLLEGDAPVRVQPGFLITGEGDGSVAVYAVSPETGELSPRGKQKLGEGPVAVATDPAGRFVYAVDLARRALSGFRLQPDGKLAPVGDAAVTLEGQLRDLRVDHRGAYVYVLTEQPNRYLSFAIDPATGKLRPDEVTDLPEDSRPQRLVATPEERLAFVLDEAGRWVFVHRYITSDAAPLMYDVGDTYGSPLVTSESPQDMVVDPTGLNGLLLDKTGGLTVYRLPGVWGPLKALGKGPVQAGKQPVAVVVHPRGGYVYVADAGTSTLRQFRLDADSGELTPSGEPVTLPAAPAAVDIDPSGRFAYVRYAAKPGLTRFVVDPQSGRLEQPRDLLDVVSPKGLAITTVLR
jgi:6-phosphogluconolactonase (cycloisomerase 2 family)